MAADKHNECEHPSKPSKPYTDRKTANLILEQGEVIAKCRALLGKKEG